jgi:hypothetical protein
MFTKKLSWQATQSIPHTTVTFFGDFVKICEDFSPNFGNKISSFCITTMHSLTFGFSPENFWPKQNVCRPHASYFSVSPIEDKTEKPPF